MNETVMVIPVVPTNVDSLNNGFKTLVKEAFGKSLDGKTTTAPATLPEIAGDMALSLRAQAPPVKNPYSMANSMCDIPCVAYALDLFLASHMLESEDYMHKGDPQK
jgi:hypothetical protein